MMQKHVVVVTGASGGLGAAIALGFGTRGNRVAINYANDHTGAADVAAGVQETGSEALIVQADVRKKACVESMVSRVLHQWGHLDILVNNAATLADAVLHRMTESDWDRVVDTVLTGTFNCMRAAASVMREKKQGGHIINIASLVGVSGRAGQANYAAAKAGIIGLTKSAARELGRDAIQVNAVLPGVMRTEMLATVSPDAQERLRTENLLARFSQPAEIAAFICHLVEIRSVSGQVFNLDSRIISCL